MALVKGLLEYCLLGKMENRRLAEGGRQLMFSWKDGDMDQTGFV
jgi:hypothetical protein